MTEAVKRTVTIAIRRPSKTPAVFVAACFTEPAWEPVELTSQLLSSKDAPTTEDSSTQVEEYEFSKKFELPEGKYQYKFRLGTDEDSWFCDNDAETVVNDDGICNNVLVVNDTSSTSATEDSKETNGTPNGTKLKELAKEEDDTEDKAKTMEDIPVDAAVIDKSDKEVPVNVAGETASEEKKPDNQVDSVGGPEASASKGITSEEKSDEKLSKEEDIVLDNEKTVAVDTTEMEKQPSSDKLENTVPEPASKELPEEPKESESRAEDSQNSLEAKKELSEKVDAVETTDPAETSKEESNDKVETPLVTESETTAEEPKNNTTGDLKTTPDKSANDVLEAEVAPEAPAIESTEDSNKEDNLPEITKEDAVPAHAEEPVVEKANGLAEETANPVASMAVEKPTVIEPEAVSEVKNKEEPAAELEKAPVKVEEIAESTSTPAVEKGAPSPEAIKEDPLATKEEPVSTEPENAELPQEEKVSDKDADPVATEDKIKEAPAAESEPVLDAVKADPEVAAVREAEASAEEPKELIAIEDIASKEIAPDDAPVPVSEKPAVANEEPEKSSNEPEATPEEPKESAPDSEPELTDSKRDTEATENSTVDELETQRDPVDTPAAADKAVSAKESELPSKEPESVTEAPKDKTEASKEVSTEKDNGTTENAKQEEAPLSVPMPEEAKDEVAEEKTEPVPATNEVEDVTEVVDKPSKEADTANEEPDKDASQPVEALKSTEDDAPVVKEAETITEDKPVEESAPEVLKDDTKEESQEPVPGPNAETAVAADEAPVNEHQHDASIEEVKELPAGDPVPADCNVPAVEDEAVVSESKDTLEPEVNQDSQLAEKKEETEDKADPIPVSTSGAQPAAEEDPVKEVPSKTEDETKEASEVPVIANIAGVEALQNIKSQANPEISEEAAGQVAQSSTPAPEPQVDGETKVPELKEPATEELAPVAQEPAAAIQKDSESGDSKEEENTSAPEKEVEAAGEQIEKPEEQKLAEPEATGDDTPIPSATGTENKKTDLPSESIKDEVAATTESSTSQVADESSDKPAAVPSEGPGEPDVSQEPKEVHIETAVVGDASKEASAQSQVEDAAVDAPIDVPEEPKQDAEAVVNVEEAPKDVQNAQNDVTAAGEEVKSEAEKSLDHVAKVNDKQSEEVVEEAPVAEKEAVEAESAPKTQDGVTVAADPAADEAPAPEPEATEEEAPKTEAANVATIEAKDALPEAADTPAVSQDTEEGNTTVEAEKPEISTSEAVTTAASPEAPEETPENPGKPAVTEAVTHTIEENTTVSENVSEPTGSASEGTTDKPAESVAKDEPEVPTNKDDATKEAILDEQLAGNTSPEGNSDPKADLPNISADSIQEAGLQGKLQSTEDKPDFVTDHAKVEENQPKESTTSKTEGQEDSHQTNGATIAAALGAAAVIPGAALLAKKAFASGETTDKKTAPGDTTGATESLSTTKGSVDDSEHINNVMVKEDSKVAAKDESSGDAKNGLMQEEPATAESTSKADATEENDRSKTIEITSRPEPVKESAAGKDDAQETVNGKVIADEESKKATPEASASADIEPSSSAVTADANASTAATTNGTKTNGTKTNGVSEETRPPTGNKSITSLTSQRRDNFLKYIWRAIFVNFFGSLFGFRRRDTTV
ncbi:hypothetical protein H109_02933 [Trichophyton interdigitale MR816]|uniref:AMP-activated protein kinase glycogen-binding domain-containing protein n=1 Tax=Trichophyton interdigitale (strain MR816) TaxID=1215338 RepID=A0A059JBK1_TRIIM|nr:hypothetical protein H109_02933 [Trichophyton interdigitale MR816]